MVYRDWLAYLIVSFILLNAPFFFSSYIASDDFTFYGVIVVNSLLAVCMLTTYSRAHLVNLKVDFARTLPVLIQGSVQLSIYYYVMTANPISDVRDIWSSRMPFVFYQIIFALTFDYLFTIWRGKAYHLHFYVIPMVLSINLFLWLLNEYSIIHLPIIIAGILIKTYVIRKDADGQFVHIFNPSFIVLSLTSLIIFAMGLNFINPNVYAVEIGYMYDTTPYFNIFVLCVGCITLWLPNSYLVSIGAYSIVMLLDQLSRTYLGYQLFTKLVSDSAMIAIMLGITDPKTSPKTSYGKLFFGVAYGLCFTFFNFLLAVSGPFDTYFAKIFAIPALNLFVGKFDTCFKSTTYLMGGYFRFRLASILLFGSIFTLTYSHLVTPSYPTLAYVTADRIRVAFGFEPFSLIGFWRSKPRVVSCPGCVPQFKNFNLNSHIND